MESKSQQNRERERHLKPIFHCNAKPLALGHRIGLDPQCNHFVLEIQHGGIQKAKAKPGGPNDKPGAPVGHVYFMLFVSIFFALGSQRGI